MIRSLPPGYTAFSKTWDTATKKVLAKHGFENVELPTIVFYFDGDFLYRQNQKPRNKKIKEIDMYGWFWFETDVTANFCSYNGDTFILRVITMRIDKEGDFMKWAVDLHQDRIDESRSLLPPNLNDELSRIMFGMMLLTRARNKKSRSILTMNRNKVSVFYKSGDAVNFTRLMDPNKLPDPNYEPPEPGSSGIKKKEHEVIGHWRTYKSGVRVWVKAHKRGDPSLGTVTKVIS